MRKQLPHADVQFRHIVGDKGAIIVADNLHDDAGIAGLADDLGAQSPFQSSLASSWLSTDKRDAWPGHGF